MEFKYFMPTEIYFGEDVVLKNKDVFKKLGRKAFIITGRNSAKKNGSYEDVTKALAEAGIEYLLFDEVEENPSLETIEKASGLGKANNVDFVIGIGGGSPMDAAKAIAVFIKNPEVNQDNVFSGRKLEFIPVVAVATTSGTGSEVTQYSIVTSNKEMTKKNLGQVIFPQVAFLDYKYTYDLPYDITVNTAIDAFSHLVEGYLNSNSTFMSEIYAERGFQLFEDCFKKLVTKDLDHGFRADVMLASTLAGILISQSGTSLPHGMGYPLTYFKGLPHGLANGVLMIEYLRSFKDQTKIEKMLKVMGMSSLAELEEILKKLITVKVKITEEEIREYAQEFIANKAKLKNHTEEVKLEDIERIYRNSL
ncbi:MAG: iron-containing alcohol dehydrogenase [Desulfitobacterium sp.]|nr:iron-containing alcohol dehydrogenase [Desulfitobacterium sp.]